MTSHADAARIIALETHVESLSIIVSALRQDVEAHALELSVLHKAMAEPEPEFEPAPEFPANVTVNPRPPPFKARGSSAYKRWLAGKEEETPDAHS
jgi:hypothetical protein